MGHVVMLEAAVCRPCAASSMPARLVYGGNSKQPSSVADPVDTPVSLYAATSRDELITHAYCHLYGIPGDRLRFFTVLWPVGTADMAAYLFADAIVHGRPIRVFNHGKMARDFTISTTSSPACWRRSTARRARGEGRVYNLGNHRRSSCSTSSPCSRRRSAVTPRRSCCDGAATCEQLADIERRARSRLRAQDPDRNRPAALRRWYKSYTA